MSPNLCLVMLAFVGGVVGIAVFVACASTSRGVMRALWVALTVTAIALAMLGFAWGGLGAMLEPFGSVR